MALNFTKQIDKDIAKLNYEVSKAISQSAKEAWKVAVRNTPHITYTAQNGWKLSNKRRSSYVPVRRKQPPPRVPQFKFRITKDKRVYLYNNVRYAEALEKGLPPNKVAHYMLFQAQSTFDREMDKRFKRIK